MKLKITITGPKVHDVGYRYFLLGLARRLAIPGFSADNFIGSEGQEVQLLLEGKEDQLKAFEDFTQNNRPEGAIVSEITTSEYNLDVLPRNEYAQSAAAEQLLKAIPFILKIEKNTECIMKDTGYIRKNTESIMKDTGQILEGVKGLREDQPSFAMQLRQLQSDMKTVKDRLGIP